MVNCQLRINQITGSRKCLEKMGGSGLESRGETIPGVGVAWSRLFYPFCPELPQSWGLIFANFINKSWNWSPMESALLAYLAGVALESESPF